MDEEPEGSGWAPDRDVAQRLNREIIAFRELFDIDQKHAIAAFFACCASQHDEAAGKALDDYWSRFLDGDKG